MSCHRYFLALVIALGLPVAAVAQTASGADDATDLDQVIVTATRTAVTVDDSLAAVEVIDRAQIQRSQARSLPDLLRGRAGISLSNQGGPGKLTTLFLRGSESDHVLVLIDGVRVGSATSGLAAFQDLPVALIDRIEIVRGPRSSLYGSEAIGGVIQIFTRRDRKGFAPRASATIGSNGLAEGSAGLGGGSERGWFGIDAAYQHSDGIDACEVATPTPFSGGCFIFAPEPDRDGYRNRSLSLRGGFDASDALSFDAHALRAEGRNAFDGDFVNLSKTVQQVLGGNATWRPSERVQLQLSAGRNTDASDNFLHKGSIEADLGYFATDRDSATLQGDFGIGREQLLTVGLDWLHDRVDSDTPFDRTARSNRAAFAQYQGSFGAHSLQASLRRDDNDQFGGHTTGGGAWGVEFADRWRATLGYGTAFKAPTFNELYFPFFGNPTLRPEQSRTWELGLRYRGDALNWRLDGFHTEVDDLIAFDIALFAPNNIARARMQGAELGIDTQFAQWTLDASASVIDTENRDGFNAGNQLPRRARHSARIELDRAFGGFRVGLTGVSEGARYDDVANSRRLGSYATLDLRGEYALTPQWTLQARLA
ncbi:MAG: TonB-dependent vitamin B12 receptor, partial [Gammaproteobacteria bacterium]|nr:TonB-dependent vitamin B12 receptor [Gammaproteobacteria bacterium]